LDRKLGGPHNQFGRCGIVNSMKLKLNSGADGLQTEEHIFWDCKLYQDQWATMMDILSENSKKEYSKSVTELLRLQKKRFVHGVCYFINKIPKFIKKEKEVNVQNINGIFLELS
jgi:hypothetical protein